MRTLLTTLFSFLIITLLVIQSCTKESLSGSTVEQQSLLDTQNYDRSQFASLKAKYDVELINKYGHNNVPKAEQGIYANGTLTTAILRDENNTPFLSLVFKSTDEQGSIVDARLFNFGLAAAENVSFPQEMNDVQVTFLGNQLIIENLADGVITNLFVDNTMNLSSSAKNVSGLYLASHVL